MNILNNPFIELLNINDDILLRKHAIYSILLYKVSDAIIFQCSQDNRH